MTAGRCMTRSGGCHTSGRDLSYLYYAPRCLPAVRTYKVLCCLQESLPGHTNCCAVCRNLYQDIQTDVLSAGIFTRIYVGRFDLQHLVSFVTCPRLLLRLNRQL